MSTDHHRILRLTASRFCRVFTYDPLLLARLPNGLMLPLGTPWVPERPEQQITMAKELSLIALAKKDHPGHRLPHQIVARPTGFLLGARSSCNQSLGWGVEACSVGPGGTGPLRLPCAAPVL